MSRKIIKLPSPPAIVVINIIFIMAIIVVCASITSIISVSESVIIGMLSEIVVLSINIVFMVYKMNSKIIVAVRDSSTLVDAGYYVVNSKDPGCSEKYKEIKAELIDLAKGHYIINGQRRVYKNDIESIKELRKNDTLYSVCPIGQQVDLIKDDILDSSFIESIKHLYDAVGRGAIIERIYVFESQSTFDTVPICKEHLNEVKGKGINVKIVYVDKIKKEDLKQAPRDFIIFNQNKVSAGIGTIGSREPLNRSVLLRRPRHGEILRRRKDSFGI